MSAIEMVRSFIEYHQAMTRQVWKSIAQIKEEQFVADDSYSRGSIRNLMVHLANTDRSWLAGLKNKPDVRSAMKAYSEYPDRASVQNYWESVAKQLAVYVNTLSEEELKKDPKEIPLARWKVLLHLVNHGTDHRSTVLQKLHELGVKTFDQDYSIWLGNQ